MLASLLATLLAALATREQPPSVMAIPAPRAVVPRHDASVLPWSSTSKSPSSMEDRVAASANTAVTTSVTAWTRLERDEPDASGVVLSSRATVLAKILYGNRQSWSFSYGAFATTDAFPIRSAAAMAN